MLAVVRTAANHHSTEYDVGDYTFSTLVSMLRVKGIVGVVT
jgi:hypothetical protein